MSRLYAIVGATALGLSSAVVLPILMLIAVVTGIAVLVIGLGNWKVRNGYLAMFKSSNLSRHRDGSAMLRAPDILVNDAPSSRKWPSELHQRAD